MGLRGPIARSVKDRFFEKVAPKNERGCTEWVGGTNGVGYGILRLGPSDNCRRVYAHRWFYEYHVGPIPEGAHLDHLCRNTLCVNHEHLEPVTPRVNNLRGVSPCAQNAAKTHCIRGHSLFGDNLYVDPTTGYRRCRECARERDRRRKPRNRKES